MMKRPRLNIKSRVPRKLKWGVAGCGKFMEEAFLPTLQTLKRSKLVSVYSSNAERAKFIAGKFGAQNYSDNFDEFLKGDFEVIYIGSANSDHYWQALKAAEAGKHIFCEKPISLTSAEAEEIVRACEKNNCFLACNYSFRFHPMIHKAKELIDKQILGKIISISASFNIDLMPGENFRFKKELSGGGPLRDLGTHVIDLFRYFNGEIVSVKSFGDNVVYKSEVEDFTSAIVKFEKGGYGNFNVSYSVHKSFNRIEIIGSNGCIGIDDFIGKKNISSKMIIDLQSEKKKTFRFRANKQIYILKAMQKSLLREENTPVYGMDALINMKIMEAIEKDFSNSGTSI